MLKKILSPKIAESNPEFQMSLRDALPRNVLSISNIVLIPPLMSQNIFKAKMKPRFPSIGIQTLAAYLKENYPQERIKVIDPALMNVCNKEVFRRIAEEQPSIVGISLIHASLKNTVDFLDELSQHINTSKIWLVFGGIEVGLNFEQVKRIFQQQRILCLYPLQLFVAGFGERLMHSIIEHKDLGNSPLDVSGVLAIENGKISDNRQQDDPDYKTSREERATYAKLLFDPAKIIPWSDYMPDSDGQVTNVTVGLDALCNGSCSFCVHNVNNGFEKHYNVRRSATDEVYARMVVDVIEKASQEFPLANFHFSDEDFLRQPHLAKCIFREIIRRRKQGGESNLTFKNLRFSIFVRADSFILRSRTEDVNVTFTIDNELVLLMKESGFLKVTLGVESFSDKVLKDMNKEMSVEQQKQVLKYLLKNKITAGITLLLFYPSVSREDIIKTIHGALEFIKIGSPIVLNPLLFLNPGSHDYERWHNYGEENFYSFDKISTDLGKENIEMVMLPVDPLIRDKVKQLMDYYVLYSKNIKEDIYELLAFFEKVAKALNADELVEDICQTIASRRINPYVDYIPGSSFEQLFHAWEIKNNRSCTGESTV